MAAPVDSARNPTSLSTAGTSANIAVGSPVAGTLLIVYVHFTEAVSNITFSGYSVLNAADSSGPPNDITVIYYRLATGSEGASDPISWTTSAKLAAICWEITGADDPAVSVPTVSTVAAGGTSANTADPGSVAPAGAPQDTLYLAIAGGDGELVAYTAAPTNYGNLQAGNSGSGGAATTNCFIGGASRQISASSSDDPGAFTHGAHATGWTAFTVAIRPPQPVVTIANFNTARVRT